MRRFLWVLLGIVLSVMVTTAVLSSNEERVSAVALAEPGSHAVSTRTETLVDLNRNGRELVTEIWYPAEDTGPFPLLFYLHGRPGGRLGMAALMAHLASYGYVVAAIERPFDPSFRELVDCPLDVLYALDTFAVLPSNHALAGLIDTEHVGVIGLSFGGTCALMLSGAQVDPQYYLDSCIPTRGVRDSGHCAMVRRWSQIAAYHELVGLTTTEDGLWSALTDDRIKAVILFAPWNGPLFGARGLSTATVGTLVVGGLQDTSAPFDRDAGFITSHSGAPVRYLLKLEDAGHYVYGLDCERTVLPDEGAVDHRFCAEPERLSDVQKAIKHLAVTFLGLYVQGRDKGAAYLSGENIAALSTIMIS